LAFQWHLFKERNLLVKKSIANFDNVCCAGTLYKLTILVTNFSPATSVVDPTGEGEIRTDRHLQKLDKVSPNEISKLLLNPVTKKIQL
jgi:hypothetical protein